MTFRPLRNLVSFFCAALAFAGLLSGQDAVSDSLPSYHSGHGQTFVGMNFEDPAECVPCTQINRGDYQYVFSGLARAFYFNDQRLQWSGQETSFGAEGAIQGAVLRNINGWDVGLETELFINQPYDRNILVDTPERVSFRGNFEIETLEISQLFIAANRGDWTFSAGKRYTPFGRTYFPLNTNALSDAPFIRTEVVDYRETGLQVDYNPGIWEFTASISNGSENLDTNSTKAGLARIGINGGSYAFGGSVKWHDGTGSESQKQRNNQVGVDGMIRRGRWTLSGEVVYDQYGFRRFFNPLDITWGRSIYNRDQFFPGLLSGVGYYVNLGYEGDRWTALVNYGNYSPNQFTGDAIHDRDTYRLYGKFIRHFGQGLDGITTVTFENSVPIAQAGRERQGFAFYTGLEYRF